MSIIYSSFTCGQDRKDPVSYETSGMIILFMGSLDTRTHNDRPVWNSSMYNILKQCKPSIIGRKRTLVLNQRVVIIISVIEATIKQLMIVQSQLIPSNRLIIHRNSLYLKK